MYFKTVKMSSTRPQFKPALSFSRDVTKLSNNSDASQSLRNLLSVATTDEEQYTNKLDDINQVSLNANRQGNGVILNADEKNEMRESMQNKKSFRNSYTHVHQHVPC